MLNERRGTYLKAYSRSDRRGYERTITKEAGFTKKQLIHYTAQLESAGLLKRTSKGDMYIRVLN